MAFLCPMRIPRRRRKRKGADEKNTLQNGAPKNRITGSSSLDSLVGIVKQEDEDYFADDPKKMVVTHDFIPCVDDELAVKRGERVLMLYRQNNWYYIKNSRNTEGFIPFTNCIAEDEYEKRQNKLSRQNIIRNTSFLDSMDSSIYPGQKVSVFMKKNFGEYVALWDFNATAEDDITASKGDVVTVLNKDDPDWYWVVKRSGDEGFIPKEFIIPADQLSVKFHDETDTYTAQQDNELTVFKGDWVYADMQQRDARGWIWAYSPASHKQGYVPRACLRPPATTPL
ncbi:predicted protein [Nematostella vectensis]|uniref:SH3 domain-containing protein n=1 Tax=Nematostella vectensis TaxID=45351 RepID=A7T1V2_NEMVE|nr:predicted protein [Nematostella vectensis]|eukprot:XP_001622159.1 predicted protein [Nematostella vectensis]